MKKRRFSSRFQSAPVRSLKLVCFRCAREYYAVDISQVEHILPEFTLHGCLESGRSLVKYKEQAIAVLDLHQLFFPQQKISANEGCTLGQYLIICHLSPAPNSANNIQHQLSAPPASRSPSRFAIPTMEMPTILEITADQLEELPVLYRQGTPGSPPAPKAIEKLIHTSDEKTIFYLNLATLLDN